jgi:hypothetical protein
MATMCYVRYWSTKNDYLVWTNDNIDYFTSSKKTQNYIDKYLMKDDPVYAYEIGYADQIGSDEDCTYENHEAYDFFKSDEVINKVEIVVAHYVKGVPTFTEVSLECSLYDVNTKNHFQMAIAKLKESGDLEQNDNAIAFEKKQIEDFVSKKQTKIKNS